MYDILIIGSGPAGCAAAVYGKRAGLRVLVIEKEYEGTGQIAQSGRVDNYPGLPGISGYELGEKFRDHAAELGAEFLEAEVTEIRRTADGFTLLCEEGEKIEGRTLIYSAGAAPRRIGVPGEEALIGAGVSFCALCDGSFYQDREVAVLGGGDTALDDALYLADICKKVYLVHRRDGFRGAESTVSLVRKKENIELVLGARTKEILGQDEVTGMALDNGRRLAVDGVFVAFGSVPQTGLLRGLVALDEAGYVPAGEDGKTEVPGLYVAGDIRVKPIRQVITAAADGANAATAAAEYLQRNAVEG